MRFDNSQPLLPIKVVFPGKEDYRLPDGGGGSTTIFGEVTPEVRASLSSQLDDVEKYFEQSFRSEPGLPGVAKVTLKREALAKSHRPTGLFNEETCPIIGGNHLGEFYISAEPQGLAQVRARVNRESKGLTANVSTVESIKVHSGLDSISQFLELLSDEALQTLVGPNGLHQDIAARLLEEQIVLPDALRLRLFRYRNEVQNRAAELAFRRLVTQLGLEVRELPYADDLRVFKLEQVSSQSVVALASFNATQSISPFPRYNLVRTMSHKVGSLTPQNFPSPDPDRDYGLVGLIDSGTDPGNSALQEWVVDRYKLHPLELQDNAHGSFVAGLIANGRALNHDDPRFPSASCRMVDVVAFDATGEADEDDLLFAVDEALEKFPHVTVWNLSLGLTGPPCNDNEFSLFGTALDERSKKHGVLFVVAAGNYGTAPFRTWPYQIGLQDADRICPPADSLCALTVGSVAHRQTPSTRVRVDEPSPFSRRGPAPGYILKPEVCHVGGNCDAKGNYIQTGVVSLDSHGSLVENIGTSFSTPLISAIAGETSFGLEPGYTRPSPALVKALTVHSAFLGSAPLKPVETHYFGVGTPGDAPEIVRCRQSAATLILRVGMKKEPNFYKDPFPIPACLNVLGTGLQGEIFMTLLYEPPMDRAFGVEYCRVNIEASLGTMQQRAGKVVYTRQVHPYPKWHSDGYFEESLVESGYKWAPLKFYHRKFSGAQIGELPWRLSLTQLNRSEFDSRDEQEVILIMTIRALNPQAQVYNQLAASIEQLGWVTQDLAVRAQNRLRL